MACHRFDSHYQFSKNKSDLSLNSPLHDDSRAPLFFTGIGNTRWHSDVISDRPIGTSKNFFYQNGKIDKTMDTLSLVAISAFAFKLSKDKWKEGAFWSPSGRAFRMSRMRLEVSCLEDENKNYRLAWWYVYFPPAALLCYVDPIKHCQRETNR